MPPEPWTVADLHARRSARAAYVERPAAADVAAVATLAGPGRVGASLVVVDDSVVRPLLGPATADTLTGPAADELAGWLRLRRRHPRHDLDGLTATTLGLSWVEAQGYGWWAPLRRCALRCEGRDSTGCSPPRAIRDRSAPSLRWPGPRASTSPSSAASASSSTRPGSPLLDWGGAVTTERAGRPRTQRHTAACGREPGAGTRRHGIRGVPDGAAADRAASLRADDRMTPAARCSVRPAATRPSARDPLRGR